MAREKMDFVTSLQWGVVLLGILATPIALHVASVVALSGPDGLTMLYPFAQIVRSPGMKVPADLAGSTAQVMMYLQFPLYALVTAKLIRPLGVLVGLGASGLIHCAGIAVVFFLSHAQNLRLG